MKNTYTFAAVGVMLALAACAGTPRGREALHASDSVLHCGPNGASDATGDRRAGADCPEPSRSFSHDEISRTGATTLSQALPQLDASVR